MKDRNGENGVKVSFREIYDATQDIAQDVREISVQLKMMEKELKDFRAAKKRSEEAYEKANEALLTARNMQEEYKWFKRKIIGALLTTIITGIAWALMQLL
jgi:hypothetical protein